jgi:hypothetical protein
VDAKQKFSHRKNSDHVNNHPSNFRLLFRSQQCSGALLPDSADGGGGDRARGTRLKMLKCRRFEKILIAFHRNYV